MKCSKVDGIMRKHTDIEITSNKNLIKHIETCKRCSGKHGLILKISMATMVEEDIPVRENFERGVWDRIKEPEPSGLFSVKMLRYKWAFAAAAGIILLITITVGILPKPGHETVAAVSNAAFDNQEQRNIPDNKPVGIKKIKTADVIKNVRESDVKSPEPSGRKSAGIDSQTGKNMGNAGDNNTDQNAMNISSVPRYINAGPAAGTVPGSGGNIPAKSGINTAGTSTVQGTPAVSNYGKDRMEKDVEVYGNIFHPFNGESVLIKYRVNEPANVIMSVYDRKGRIIKRIYSGARQPGIYAETWDGRQESGSTAGEGIYYIYLKVGTSENRIKTGIIK
jgi:hypothetical protein